MNQFISLFSISGLLFLAFILYNDYRVDRLRQDLFEIRDRLFDDAAEGRISFDSKAYKVTRATLNGMIRFGHKISLLGVLITILTRQSKSANAASREIADAYRFSNSSDRDICLNYLDEAHAATAKHLSSAPLVYLLLIPALALLVSHMTGKKIIASIKKAAAALDAPAYREGSIAA